MSEQSEFSLPSLDDVDSQIGYHSRELRLLRSLRKIVLRKEREESAAKWNQELRKNSRNNGSNR